MAGTFRAFRKSRTQANECEVYTRDKEGRRKEAKAKEEIRTKEKKLSNKSAFEENGISCDPNHWKAICATAKKVLVPDSEQSHSSAGAEVDDSN